MSKRHEPETVRLKESALEALERYKLLGMVKVDDTLFSEIVDRLGDDDG